MSARMGITGEVEGAPDHYADIGCEIAGSTLVIACNKALIFRDPNDLRALRNFIDAAIDCIESNAKTEARRSR